MGGCYKYMEELWRHKQSDAIRFFSASVLGNTANARRSLVSTGPPVLTRHTDWVTKPSRDTSWCAAESAVEGASAPITVVLYSVSPNTRVSTTSSSTATSNPSP